MYFNFALILVVSTFATGVIWLVDRLVFFPRRQAALPADAKEIPEPVLVEYARAFFPILLLVLVLRSFLVEPFKIPSGSMKPTLLIGDFILVNKYSYGLRLPVLNNKILEVGGPQRGDVAVFRYPVNPREDYIKRVIGLPGDVIRYGDKRLTINGEVVNLADQGVFIDPDTNQALRELEEYLAGVEHRILVDTRFRRPVREWVVPQGHYFMMGDNRDNSSDSRVWGFVPEENLVGRAFLIWFSSRSMFTAWPRWSRIGTPIE